MSRIDPVRQRSAPLNDRAVCRCGNTMMCLEESEWSDAILEDDGNTTLGRLNAGVAVVGDLEEGNTVGFGGWGVEGMLVGCIAP